MSNNPLQSKNKGHTWVFSLGADELEYKDTKDTSLVYFGHHGDKHAEKAKLVFPTALSQKNEDCSRIFCCKHQRQSMRSRRQQ